MMYMVKQWSIKTTNVNPQLYENDLKSLLKNKFSLKKIIINRLKFIHGSLHVRASIKITIMLTNKQI